MTNIIYKNGIAMKRCKKCGQEKNEIEFEASKKRPRGYGARCKKCATLCSRKYRPLVLGKKQQLGSTKKEIMRQNKIVKYGLDVIEAMDSIHDDYFDVKELLL